jgi:hypothetical protein
MGPSRKRRMNYSSDEVSPSDVPADSLNRGPVPVSPVFPIKTFGNDKPLESGNNSSSKLRAIKPTVIDRLAKPMPVFLWKNFSFGASLGSTNGS